MKTAGGLRLIAGVLALCGLVALAGQAEAQGRAQRGSGPEPGASLPQSGSDATLPPQQLPDGQGADAEAPAGSDEVPTPGQGCPDQGRKLELIV
jgi:hypothetical protein